MSRAEFSAVCSLSGAGAFKLYSDVCVVWVGSHATLLFALSASSSTSRHALITSWSTSLPSSSHVDLLDFDKRSSIRVLG